jgi:hypothetical protein
MLFYEQQGDPDLSPAIFCLDCRQRFNKSVGKRRGPERQFYSLGNGDPLAVRFHKGTEAIKLSYIGFKKRYTQLLALPIIPHRQSRVGRGVGLRFALIHFIQGLGKPGL